MLQPLLFGSAEVRGHLQQQAPSRQRLFGLLALAMKSLPMGSAYMVWTGIGAVGAWIRVKAAGNGGQAMRARIVRPGLVEVQLGDD